MRWESVESMARGTSALSDVTVGLPWRALGVIEGKERARHPHLGACPGAMAIVRIAEILPMEGMEGPGEATGGLVMGVQDD